MDSLKTAIKLPKIQLALILGVLGIAAVIFGRQKGAAITVPAALLICISIDYLLIRLRKIQPFLLSAAMVSGPIVGLLAFPLLPWYYLLTVCFLAIASKNFLRRQSRHFFNPAALGLFLAGLIFHENISWWGVVYDGIILLLLLLVPAYVSVFRMKKTWSIVGFLFIFGLIQVILRISHSSVLSILESTILSPQIIFFSLVMLPEPMTSPNNSKMQLLYGILVAVVASLGSFVKSVFIPDPLILGLLTGNFVFYWIRLRIP